MKKFFLLSMLVALMSMMGVSPVLADSGDSADDPLNLGSGTCSFTWAGSNVWFKAVVPAGRTLVTTPSEGTVQADVYDCYDDVASESYITKTFNASTPFKYENSDSEDATIYVKVKNVLNATDMSFSSWFDYVEAPTNTTWQTATEFEEGTLTLGPIDKEHNAPLWYKVVVPANTKVTMQKNYPHTCLIYAGDDNAESDNFLTGIFMYGSTKATWTNNASESVNLYIQVSATSGIAPYTFAVSFETATPDAGSAWNYPIAMVEGANKILAINSANHDPMWYACKVAAHNKVTFTNDYWDITTSFYDGDEAAKADAEPDGSAFGASSTRTFENNSGVEKTVYMKVIYSQGFAQYAQVSVAFEELPVAAVADVVAGDYTGTYSLVSASSGYPMGKSGSLDGQTLTVSKNTDSTVDLTLPAATLGDLAFASYTIYNVAVDADGNLSGGSLADGQSYASFSAWGSAYTFDVTGTLDAEGKAADVTINIHASVMPGAVADLVMTFKTPVVTPADKVAGEYTGTYSLDSAEGGAPAGYTGSMDGDVKMTVAKVTDTTVDITLPSGTISQMPYLSYTVKNVTVDADGNLSGGDLGGESYVTIGMGWGSASAFSVSGTLDGTNADVKIAITASTVAGTSNMEMSFKTATVEPTADKVVGDYIGTYSLDEVTGGSFLAGRTSSLETRTLSVTKNSDTTVNISTPLCSFEGITFYSLTINDVTVDAEGNLSGGTFTSQQMGPWGTANAMTVSGKLDGTNAEITFYVSDANIMANASTVTLSFNTAAATVAPADAVVGDYAGTYSLESAVGGAPAGYTGSMDGDVTMTVAKVSDTTVDITLPSGTISQMPYLSYTVKNVTVDADGNLSGGDLGGESYVTIGMGWGSASAFSVSGTLDGTNADVKIAITASTVAGTSDMVMTFKSGTATSLNQVATQQNGEVYNLQGVRVNDSYKGIVIKNGKKYLNK